MGRIENGGKVHYISPYSTDLPINIGKAINDAISILNCDMDDWIVLTDHDVLFLLPDTKAHIESILQTTYEYSTNYDLLGCLTNRVGIKQQCLIEINDDDSILEHIRIANECWEQFDAYIQSHNGDLAAFLLCFRKSTWQSVGGFEENSLTFDRQFTRAVRKQGGKVGIMQGVYVWHTYRLGSKNPQADIKHLI